MEATEHGLSNLITSLSKKNRKKQWISERLFIRPIRVYLIRARSELLRDPDRLRELSLDLSKKNRAVLAVCVIVAGLTVISIQIEVVTNGRE